MGGTNVAMRATGILTAETFPFNTFLAIFAFLFGKIVMKSSRLRDKRIIRSS